MKREFRLLKNQEFKKVLDNHQCVSRENFVIYYKYNQLEHCRVGVSVSSKFANSVIRHKIKRQVVSMVDNYLDFNLNYDIVIIVRNKYLNYDYAYNYEVLKNVFCKILKKEK